MTQRVAKRGDWMKTDKVKFFIELIPSQWEENVKITA